MTKSTNPEVAITLPQLGEIHTAWSRVTYNMSDSGLANVHTHRNGPACTHPDNEHDSNCCRRHAVVLPGVGKKDYPFPTTDELVAQAIAYFNALARAYERQGKKLVIGRQSEDTGGTNRLVDEDVAESEGHESFFAFVERHGLPQLPVNRNQMRRARRLRNSIMRTMSTDEGREILKSGLGSLAGRLKDDSLPSLTGETGPAVGPTLRIAAGTLAEIMHVSRFKSVIARQFDSLKGACNWALENMPEKYQATALSLKDQLEKLEEIYAEALPRMIQFLGAQYPKATEEELLSAAVSVLNEQLAEILYVLSIWTDAFGQQRDGMYKQLLYVIFTVEQAFFLNRTGDINGKCDEECQKRVKSHAFHIGDVFMARFGDQGPATIPGGRGPVGAHAIEVPHDEADVIVIFLPLYLHEFEHDYYNDVEGLPENTTMVVVQALQKAYKEGRLKFEQESITIGKQTVRMIDIVTQVYAQTLSETDADINGGVAHTGEAFGYSMLSTFTAFNIRGVNPMNADKMLRNGSWFAIGQGGELAFEPHMPDYLRAYVVAAEVERCGFPAAAQDIRAQADGAGSVVPDVIYWRNIDPKSPFKFRIEVPCAALKAAAPIVVEALRTTPMEALGGVSWQQLVNWNARRQEKVEVLIKLLMAGKSDLPTDIGDVWAPYVAAAAITAVWRLWRDGKQPMLSVAMVEGAARRMLDQVRAQHDERLTADEQASVAVPLAVDGKVGEAVVTARKGEGPVVEGPSDKGEPEGDGTDKS